MEIIEETETRKPILRITHLEASRLLALIPMPDSWDTYKMIADTHRSTNSVIIENTNKTFSQDAVTSYHLGANRITMQTMSREYKIYWNEPARHRIHTIVDKEISK
jgi:hypothetical protein